MELCCPFDSRQDVRNIRFGREYKTLTWYKRKTQTLLTTCMTCRKPGVRYFYNHHSKNGSKHRYAYYVHSNEGLIGHTVKPDGTIRYKYRICYENGRIYDNLDDLKH